MAILIVFYIQAFTKRNFQMSFNKLLKFLNFWLKPSIIFLQRQNRTLLNIVLLN